MNRLLSHFALVILGVTPVFVASVALASTLTLDGLIRTEARQVVGYQIDSDLSHLFSGPGAGPVSDSRTLHTEGSLPGSGVNPVADGMYEGEARFGELRGRAEGGVTAGRAYVELRLNGKTNFALSPERSPSELRWTSSSR